MIVASELTQFKAYNAHKTEVLPVWGHAGLNTKKNTGQKTRVRNGLIFYVTKPQSRD